MNFNIKIEDNNFTYRVNQKITKRMEQAMGKAVLLVERDAKLAVPHTNSTGILRQSINSEVENRNNVIIGTVGTPIEYAPYVEYGTGIHAENGNGRKDVPWVYYDERLDMFFTTSGQEPQPFLRPALEKNKPEIERLIREAFKDV